MCIRVCMCALCSVQAMVNREFNVKRKTIIIDNKIAIQERLGLFYVYLLVSLWHIITEMQHVQLC